MRRKVQSCVLVVSFIALAGTLCLAQDFSADMVDLNPAHHGSGPTKIFVSGDKIRIEARDARGGGVMILDMAAQKSYMLMPAQHMYMEVGAECRGTRSCRFGAPRTSTTPAAIGKSGGAAENPAKTGPLPQSRPDTVNGRSAIEYEGTSADGEKELNSGSTRSSLSNQSHER